MGNHDVGRGMHAGAVGYWVGRTYFAPEPSPAEALNVLDQLAEPYRGTDAEFDDYLDFDQPLGRLINIAYAWTKEDQEKDIDGNDWYEFVYRRFRQRYEFC